MAVLFEKAAKVDKRGVALNFLGNALPRLGSRGSGTVRNDGGNPLWTTAVRSTI
jgi:hypothetical protein